MNRSQGEPASGNAAVLSPGPGRVEKPSQPGLGILERLRQPMQPACGHG